MDFKRFCKKGISLLLSCMFVVSVVPNFSVAASAKENDDTPDTSVQSSVDGNISLNWKDSTTGDTLSDDYDIVSSSSASRAITMTASYNIANVREQGYKRGELSIEVKGIGDICRNTTLQANVAADYGNTHLSSDKDWSYTWNSSTDTYTFKNNHVIKGNSRLDGYFDLVWNIEPRKSINDYSQNDIQAVMHVADDADTKSNVLSVRNKTVRDEYDSSIVTERLSTLDGISLNPADYIFVKYNLKSVFNEKARGASNCSYVFNADSDAIGKDIILYNGPDNMTVLDGNCYEISSDTFDRYILVAYPKTYYRGKTINATLTGTGKYADEDETVTLSTSTKNLMLSDFDGVSDFDGTRYNFRFDIGSSSLDGSRISDDLTATYYSNVMLAYVVPDGTAIEIYNDLYYGRQNNGKVRLLTSDEYNISSVTIPSVYDIRNNNHFVIKADTYDVSVYAVSNGENIRVADDTRVYTGKLTTSEHIVKLPANTTSYCVRIENLTETVSFSIRSSVNFHFGSQSDVDEDNRLDINSGYVYAFAAFKILDTTVTDGQASEKWTDAFSSPDSYHDYANLDIVNKTNEIYGGYPYRCCQGTFVEHTRFVDDYSATAKLSNVHQLTDKYTVDAVIGADYSYHESTPHTISLSTVLPDGLSLAGFSVPEQLWDAVSVSGLGLSEDELISHCTPTIDGQKVKFDFNFDDVTLPMDSKIEIKFTCNISRNSVANKRSVVLFIRNDVYIDSYHDSQTGMIQYINPNSAQLQLVKLVKTEYSNDYASLPSDSRVSFGGNYSYMLELINGSSEFTNVVIKDILDRAENSAWQGTLQSVEIKSKINGIVYLSENDNPSNDLSSDDWAINTDANKAKAVAVNFGSNVLKPGQVIDVVLNMKATEDTGLKTKAARNKCNASLTEHLTDSTIEPEVFSLDSNTTAVSVVPKLRNLIITKEDAVSGEKLSNAKFELRNKATNCIVAIKTTNGAGYAVFEKIPTDVEYVLKETSAPQGYELNTNDNVIKFADEDYKITVKDDRKLGAIKVYKTNSRADDVAVAGAEYALIDSGNRTVQTAKTDDLGVILFSDLAWDTYTVKEISSPSGYKLNDTEYKAVVSRDTLDLPVSVYVSDEQTNNVTVKLVKYESQVNGSETDKVLPNAQFKLSRITKEGSVSVGKFTTDDKGEITVNNLAYGQYVFVEVKAPQGFNYCSDIRFSVGADTHDLTLTAYDMRKPGSVEIFKTISTGDVAADCEFKLYNSNDKVVATGVTDEYGHIKFDGLDWGDYYFKETSCPDYYKLNTNVYNFTINAKNLSHSFNVVNDVTKGFVVLTKTNEVGNAKLKGAVFNLYKNDGTLVSNNLTTNDDGQIIVTNLDWGTYYFKEITAPAGYVLSDDNIRFVINKDTAVVSQELVVSNALDSDSNARTIVLTQKIKADEINFDNGKPSFLFTIHTDKDIYDKAHTYHRMVVFDKRYVDANVDSNGYVTQSVFVSGIPAGNYTVSEQNSQRYVTTSVSDTTNGSVNADTNTVSLNLTDNMRASTTFESSCREYREYSDNASLSNMLKKNAKYVGLKAIWTGDDTLIPNEPLNLDYLTVKAVYDDGSTKVVDANECVLDMTDAPALNGQYQVNVSYEENGVTCRGKFNIIADYGAVMTRITAVPTGIINDYIIGQGDSISADNFNVTGVYSDGTTCSLSADEYEIDKTVAPTGEAGVDVPVTITADDKFTPAGSTKRLSTVVTLVTDAVRAEVYEIGTPVPSDVVAIMYADDTMVVKGKGKMRDWDYPSESATNAVPWYNSPYRQSVTSCVIQDGVTNIGNYMLYEFTNLESVSMADSVTSIGSDSFRSSALKRIKMSNCITIIGGWAFMGCKNLKVIVIPDSVQLVGGRVFDGCLSLVDVTIGKGLTELSEEMFSGCISLESIVIPDNILSIGSSQSVCTEYGNGDPHGNTFSNCKKLSNITFSENTYCIGANAFWNTAWYNSQPDGVVYAGKVAYGVKGNERLEGTLTFRDDTLGIAEQAFYSQTSVSDVILSDNIKYIGDYAFAYMYNLKNVIFNNNLKVIGQKAFYDDFYYSTELVDIVIPDGIEIIGNYAFDSCKHVKTITIGKGDTLFGYSAFRYMDNLESVIMDDGAKQFIGANMFDENHQLNYVKLGNGTKNIGSRMFSYCRNLKSLSLPDSIEQFNDYAFTDCGFDDFDVSTFELPKNLKTIGKSALHGLELTTLSLPVNVEFIGESAFANYALKTINVDSNNANYCVVDNVLYTKDLTTLVLCPGASDLSECVVPSGVSTIGCSAFAGSNIKSVTLPDSVKTIKTSAFSSCELSNIIFGTGLETIDSYAFSYCSNLSNVILPNSLKSIGENAFYICRGLTSVNIPDSVESVGDDAFKDCSNLKDVSVNIKNIGSGMFSGCDSLETIVISDNVESIGSRAFEYCDSLKNISIGNNVKNIGTYAFEHCDSLETIVIPDNVESIGGSAFSECDNLTSVTFGKGIKQLGDIFYYYRGSNITNVVLPQDFNVNCGNFTLKRVTQCPVDNVVSWLECLADRTGQETYTFEIGPTNLAKLSDDQKAIATNKNWILK